MTVIIWGPPGSGKTLNAERLAEFYKCNFIVDMWTEGDIIKSDGLYLTHQKVPGAIYIKDALRALEADGQT